MCQVYRHGHTRWARIIIAAGLVLGQKSIANLEIGY